MPSMATITLVGHIGTDPEIKETRVRFRMAVNTRRSGEKVTTWYDVTIWGKQAEWMAEKVRSGEAHKGSLVLVQGDVEARPWTGSDGQQRLSLDVAATKAMIIGAGSSEGGQEPPF